MKRGVKFQPLWNQSDPWVVSRGERVVSRGERVVSRGERVVSRGEFERVLGRKGELERYGCLTPRISRTRFRVCSP